LSEIARRLKYNRDMDITTLPRKIENCSGQTREEVDALRELLTNTDIEVVVIALYEKLVADAASFAASTTDADDVKMSNEIHCDLVHALAHFDNELAYHGLGGLVARVLRKDNFSAF
jgi:hypothetical protein